MKKILVVGPSLNAIGGISSFLNGLLSSRISDYFDFQYFDTFWIKKRSSPQASTFNLGGLFGTFNVFYHFIKELINGDYHVIYINTSSYWGFWEKSIFVLLSKLFFKKIVLTVHGAHFNIFFDKSRLKPIILFVLKSCDRVAFVSKSMAERFSSELKVNNSLYLPNPVVITRNVSASNISIELSDLLNDLRSRYQTLYLSISLLEDRKRVIDIISNFQPGKGECLLIVGDGPELNAVEKLVSISKDVVFLGPRSGLEKDFILNNCDVFIQNSLSESFGITIIESLLARKILITTKVGVLGGVDNSFDSVIFTDCFTKRDQIRARNITGKELDFEKAYNFASIYTWNNMETDFKNLFSL